MTTANAAPTTVGSTCRQCGFGLVNERGAVPWCERCGWNLDVYEPDRREQDFRWRWLDRLAFRAAYRRGNALYSELAGRPVGKARRGWSGLLLMAISFLLVILIAGTAAAGVYVIARFGWILGDVVGGTLVLIAFVLRPRFGRRPKYAEAITRDVAPGLFRLIDDVSTATGAPAPHFVYASSQFNAWASACGPLQRRSITLGLPLWASLPPQERVALLSHELAHFVNGDVRRSPLRSMALSTFRTLSYLTSPSASMATDGYGAAGLVVIVSQLIVRPIMAVFNLGFAIVQIGMEMLVFRSSQRAEYYADELAASVAGSTSATRLLDSLVVGSAVSTVVVARARRDPSPAAWREAAEKGRDSLADRVQRLRQLSTRDSASVFHSHPPTGLRALLIESRPYQTARVVLTEADAERIDAEMASYYRTVRTWLTSH